MAKQDVVAAAKLQLVADQDAALQAYGEACYDGGLADAPPGGGVDQSVVDGLNQQIADLTAKDAADVQAIADTKAQGDAALASLQAQFDTLAAKEGTEAGVIQNLQSTKDQLAAILTALTNLGMPVPTPAPVDPAPVDPAPVDPAPADPAV